MRCLRAATWRSSMSPGKSQEMANAVEMSKATSIGQIDVDHFSPILYVSFLTPNPTARP